MRKFLILSFQIFLTLSLLAQASAGYYSAAEGKSEAALKTQLSSIISSGYKDQGYDGLWNVYKTSDNTAEGKVWDMYSTLPGRMEKNNAVTTKMCVIVLTASTLFPKADLVQADQW